MSGTFFHSQADNRGFEKLCGRDYCGREPALPAFSTDAHPLKDGAVSCLELEIDLILVIRDNNVGIDLDENIDFQNGKPSLVSSQS